MLLFSHSVKSSSLWPHGLQHARLPCPSLPNFFLLDINFFSSKVFIQILPDISDVTCRVIRMFQFPSNYFSDWYLCVSNLWAGGGPTPSVPPLLILECSSQVTVERKVLVVCHINTPVDYYCKIVITIILLLLSLLQNPGLNWRK